MNQPKSMRHSFRRSAKIAGALALSLVIIGGCSETKPASTDPNAAGAQQKANSIKIEKISKQKIAVPVERVADIQSSLQLDVMAKSSGEVEQVLKKRGDFVQEGDVIVKLKDSPDAQWQLEKAALAVQDAQNAIAKAQDQARKDLANSRADMDSSIQKASDQVDDLTKNYNKTRNDYDAGLATRDQVDQAEKQLKAASADLDQLKKKRSALSVSADTSDLQKQLRDAQTAQEQLQQSQVPPEITAPVSGVLTNMQPLEAGMPLQAGAKIGVIQKMDPILIKAQLPEAEAKLVRGKKELSYHLSNTPQMLKGEISFLSDIIDPESKTYELDLEVPNKDMFLKPGMRVQVRLTEEQEGIVTAVPTYSIVKEGEDSFVFVYANGQVEKRKLQLGRLNEPYQEVLSGVKEGELVVTAGQTHLQDKQKVELPVTEGQK